MEEIIRVIETVYPFGGRRANVYIFCLPSAVMNRLGEVMEQMRHRAPLGVEQFVGDGAGLLIYAREGTDNVSTCLATLSVINLVLQTGLKLETGYPGSFFFVNNYGHWEDATTFADLQHNPNFVLPYMVSSTPPA